MMTPKDDRQALPSLTTHKLNPENQETPLKFLREWITPEQYFFLRNHFSYPELDINNLSLVIDGEVHRPSFFRIDELEQMPSRSLVVALECSGNKRAFFDPEVFGVQWREGAISQGIWTGVPLRFLLEKSGLKERNKAREVVFEGHDYGTRKDMPGVFSYARSLPVNMALHPDTLVAYELNGKPIPYKHGYPLRLVVPGWYGMAWVKWLKRISVINGKFSGPFQTIDYNYYPEKNTNKGKHPVTFKNVNSTIINPHNLAIIDDRSHLIEGIAWTGKGSVTEVEVSIDNGKIWRQANLRRYPVQSYAWVYWNYPWNPSRKGEFTIRSRAKDSCGRIQPAEPYWNRKGYGYNADSVIRVEVQ